jgi:hypothetical protein
MAGCSSLTRNALPLDKVEQAEPLGMSNVRAPSGNVSPHLQADIITSLTQEVPGYFAGENGQRQYNALALSGGGSHGAFGAGFLIGATDAGLRPRFKLITGISTGALIAPFAFLGPEYDDQLKEAFTSINTKNIMEINSPAGIVGGESFAKTGPLASLIEKYFDEDFLQAVAAAHNQGRRLYIGTTNLDTQRLIVWNMGLIANSDSPYALALFQKVILASASIPAAFPPVMIKVEADGEIYDEMHVDGGTRTQVFFYGGTLDLQAAARAAGFDDSSYLGNIYIIRNGHLSPEPEIVERKLMNITGRAIDTMIKSAAVSDLYRIYAFAQRENINFHYIDIPDDLVVVEEEAFDPVAMNALFDAGYKLGLSADPWEKAPPGLLNSE